jgi:hypothetical protein
MSKFNLDNYETVKERKARFRESHADGRITAKIINSESVTDFALFEARIYKDASDQERDLPLGVGYAMELRDKEKSVSNYGKEYESVNYTSWTENAEESAVGRALDNAGYASNKAPSREEMAKVDRMSSTIAKVPQNEPQKPTEASPNKVQEGIAKLRTEVPSSARLATEAQVKAVWAISKNKGMTEETVHEMYGVQSLKELTFEQVSQFIQEYGSL